MKTDPIGAIRKIEILNLLRALALARPEWSECLAVVAMAFGLDEFCDFSQTSERLILKFIEMESGE